MKKKLITKGDVILIISAVLFGVILLIMMRSFMHKGKRIKNIHLKDIMADLIP